MTEPAFDRMGRPIRRRSLQERLWDRIDRRGPEQCWLWKGTTNPMGYGIYTSERGRTRLAHRRVLEESLGRTLDALAACHHCDNPPCCNPAHLFVGTKADNSADMVRKGRSPIRRGETSGKAKLTAAQVADLRRRYGQGEPIRDLGREFGIAPGTVTNIARGLRRQWDGLVDGRPVVAVPGRTDRVRAQELYEAGWTTTQIAIELGTHAGNISRILRARGVTMRAPHSYRATPR